MAALEENGRKILVRVVYDGPAFAGKTTNVRALCGAFAESRRSNFQSPGARGDRTLYLDWLRVDTGLVAGKQLSCHFITVPGQRVFARRREFLLDLADVVVFVCSAEPDSLVEAASSFSSLRQRMLRSAARYPLVVQLNKIDCAGAISVDRMRAALQVPPEIPVVEAIAAQQHGVRETAVLAIRRAADLVQDQILSHGIESLNSPLAGAERLREWIIEHEERDGRSLVDVVLGARPIEAVDVTDRTSHTPSENAPPGNAQSGNAQSLTAHPDKTNALPILPTYAVSSGMIWPANEGRDLLKRALRKKPERLETDGPIVRLEAGFWSLSTDTSRVFHDQDDARTELLSRARRSIQLGALRVPRLIWCITRGPSGQCWLWRVAPDPASLEDHLAHATLRKDETSMAQCLRLLVEAQLELSELEQRTGARVARSLCSLGILDGRIHCLERFDAPDDVSLPCVLAGPLLRYPITRALTIEYLALVASRLGRETKGAVVSEVIAGRATMNAAGCDQPGGPLPTGEPPDAPTLGER